MNLLVIGAGGALGALARYGLGTWIQSRTGTFPWGTLVVNIAGSFLLGVAYTLLESWAATPELRRGVTVGFLGAFTTFSTFSFETLALIQDGAWGRGMTYIAASVLLGLAGAALGLSWAGSFAASRT